MSRPKGSKNFSTQQKGDPSRAEKHNKYIRKTLKELTIDLIRNDWYIKIGLTVSGIQLAVAYTYTTGSAWSIFISGFSAFGKAAFVEGGMWLINRTISHARRINIHWFWQGCLWVIVVLLLRISMSANLSYEYEKKVALKYPNQKIVVNNENIDNYLTFDERIECWERGGLIPLLVLASILIGRLMLTARDEYEKDEMQRFKVAQRQAGYVAKRKKLKVELGGE